ncbi:transporter [Citrobacter freundii]|nr:transporter [Citrobacter freundii]
MWLMGLAALCMVILFTFLLFRKIRTNNAAPEKITSLAAETSGE